MQKDEVTVEEGPQPDPALPHAIILDLTPVNFLDTVGVKTLRNVRETIQPTMCLSDCLSHPNHLFFSTCFLFLLLTRTSEIEVLHI